MKTNHEEEDSVFETIVKDKNDAIAMIAYCFYKLEKLDYFKQNPTVDDKEKHNICRALAGGERLNRIKRDARDMLSESLNSAVTDYCKNITPKKFRYGVYEGIVAGLILTIAAPFVWAFLYHLLLKADIWNPFVSMINSFPKK